MLMCRLILISGYLGFGLVKGTGSALAGCLPSGKSQGSRLSTGLLFLVYVLIMFSIQYDGGSLWLDD